MLCYVMYVMLCYAMLCQATDRLTGSPGLAGHGSAPFLAGVTLNTPQNIIGTTALAHAISPHHRN